MPRTNGICVFYLAIAQGICSWESENEFLANTMPQRLTPTLETKASQLKPSGGQWTQGLAGENPVTMESRVGRRKVRWFY